MLNLNILNNASAPTHSPAADLAEKAPSKAVLALLAKGRRLGLGPSEADKDIVADLRRRFPKAVNTTASLRFQLTVGSSNDKVSAKGELAWISTSAKGTCPNNCPLKDAGCYGKNDRLGRLWAEVTDGRRGLLWDDFLTVLRAARRGKKFRHNQVGDLPGDGRYIDAAALEELRQATRHLNAWTYTHYIRGLDAYNLQILQEHMERIRRDGGILINASCSNEAEVEAAKAIGMPATIVIESPAVKRYGGHHVVTCPAQVRDEMACVKCMLCAKNRKSIVGFLPHGRDKNNMPDEVIVRSP